MFFQKKIEEDYSECKNHEQKIADFLELKNLPAIFYGEDAKKQLLDYVEKNGENWLLKTNGCFIHKNLPDEFKDGVICVTNASVSTLAHELVHYKQFKNNSHWLHKNRIKKLYYSTCYDIYPSEREAFFTARKYLKSAGLKKEKRAYTWKIITMFIEWNLIRFIGVIILIILSVLALNLILY